MWHSFQGICSSVFVMADETDLEGEWLDFSSSNFENKGDLFKVEKDEDETEDPKEDLGEDTNTCSSLENLRELLKQSLPDVRQEPCLPQVCTASSSVMNESSKHWYVIIYGLQYAVNCKEVWQNWLWNCILNVFDLIVMSTLVDRIWVGLVSNLNAVRQAKWADSCLQDCYYQSLQISKDIVSNPLIIAENPFI